MTTSLRNYEYSVRYSNQTVSFSSSVEPGTMQSYLVELYNLFRSADLNEIALSFGETMSSLASEGLPSIDLSKGGTNRLFDRLGSFTVETHSHQEQWVGEILLKACHVWHTTKGKGLQKPLADQFPPDTFLHMVDELLEECSEHLQVLYHLRVVKGFSAEQCARIEHISTATFHRYWRNLKCQLGSSLLRRCGEDMHKVQEVFDKIGYFIR